ncbi:hypothetical protein [Nonomuraea roseola]|uniref:Uncharacterized protein n=1 Tax=Nonomuraea roseola TaxID=46179 RepID=A0ABV5QFT1_9ACTN
MPTRAHNLKRQRALAAAHGAEGLCSGSWVWWPQVRCPAWSRSRHVAAIEATRERFVRAIGNIDIPLDMLGGLHTVLGED